MSGGFPTASAMPKILLYVQVDVGDEGEDEDDEVMRCPQLRNITLSQ